MRATARRLSRYLRPRIDLVFMDCQMPVMDGYSATRRIRDVDSNARNHEVPIVALTTMRGDREKCIAAGMETMS
ncbi:MAG: response regulator [Lysobacterales bacterium]